LRHVGKICVNNVQQDIDEDFLIDVQTQSADMGSTFERSDGGIVANS